MNYPKSNKYDKQFLKENMMGPNCIKLLEELTSTLPLKKGMRVLDLGCGKGLTSIFLAKEFGVKVFATDLWITATENYNRFKEFGLEDEIIPIHANALNMPYAEDYFDAIISVDAYHYFGRDPKYMDILASFIKKDGIVAISVPGLKYEKHDPIPEEMLISWTPEELDTMPSCNWWKNLLEQSNDVAIDSITEMENLEECWNDWLECDNEYAKNDVASMRAGAGKYMNFISIIGRKK